ncbi:TraC family protein [Bdellovibrionota bacterium FG-2]
MKSIHGVQIPDPIARSLWKNDLYVDALFKRPESLGALLPYDEYLPAQKVFRMKDGSLGAVFEATLLEHEPMTSDQIIAAVDGLRSWFHVPSNTTLQITFDQAAISPLDARFRSFSEAYRDPNPVSKFLYDARVSGIQGACNTTSPLAPFERRLWISLRYFPTVSAYSGKRMLMQKGEALLLNETKEFVRELQLFSHLVTDFEHSSKIKLRQCGAQDLLDVLRRFFNPKTYYKRSFATFNPNVPLSDQLIYSSPTLDYLGIQREGVMTRTLTLKTSPQFAYPGGMAYFTKLGFPFRLSLNFKFPTKSETKTFFDLKEFFLQNTPSARAKRQREEVLEVQDKLARDDRCLHMTFTLVVEGETEEVLDQRVRDVVNIFHNDLECETIVEDKIGLGLCLNSLPLNYIPKSDHASQRFIRILRSDATKLVPIFDSFRGLERPLQLYLSRENNLVKFSLLENETSNHTVVLADSGSGKSAFIIDCIQAAKRMSPEPLVFVVDKKSSYPMMSHYFDGELTAFDRNQPMPFTPFRGVYDEEKIAFLTQLLMAAIKLTSPAFGWDSTKGAALTQAIRNAHTKRSREIGLVYVDGALKREVSDAAIEITMEEVVAELSSLPSMREFETFGAIVEELTQALLPFYGEGIYAHYFRGAPERANSRRTSLYIYDLDALDSDPLIQALMTMSVFEEIRRIIRLPANTGRTGFIVLEELGMLGRDNPTASRMIVDFAETLRKMGYWLISLTPRPQNYFELEVGRAMWGVADNFIFMQMGADNVDYLLKHSALLDEASSEIVKSLRTKRGSHAEVFYMNKKKTKQGAFKYFQTPYDRWLAPTNSKDMKEATEALLRFPGEKWKALEYLAATYPQGVQGVQGGGAV